MNALKRILSVIMVLAMLLSCMGAAPFEAVAEQTEQEGVTVSDMIEVENVPSEPEPTAEPAEETESAAEPAEETEPAAEPAEETESAAEPAEVTESAAEPAEEIESAAEPEEKTEPAAEPAEEMTLSLDDGIMPIAEPAPPEGAEKVTATWTVAENITYDGDSIDNTTDIKAEYTANDVTGEPTYTYVNGSGEEVTSPTNAGTYIATATWTKDGGSGTVYDTQEFTIKRAPLTVTINGGALIYTKDYKGSAYTIDDLSINFTVNGAQGNDQSEINANAVFWDENKEKRTDPVIDAGNYSIGYELTYGDAKATNYEVQPFDAKTLTISPVALELTLNDGLSETYSGAPIELKANQFKATGLVGNDTLVSVVTNAVNAGEYQGADITVTKILAKRAGSDDEVDVTANYNPIKLTGTLTVEPFELPDEAVGTIGNTDYNGSVQELKPKITYNKAEISEGEFDYAYSNDTTNVGEVTVTVTGKTGGNYTFGNGSVERKYKITPLSIKDESVTVEGLDPLTSPVTYTGAPQPPALKVLFDGVDMVESDKATGNNYTVTYDGKEASAADLTSARQIKVVITGHGNFKDTREGSYTIDPKDLGAEGAVTVTVDPATMTYTGKAQEPKVTVHDVARDVDLVMKPGDNDEGDYTVEYANNINAGTASVTITGVGNYTGTTTANFTINKKSLKDTNVIVEFDPTEMTYTGSALTPKVTVTYGDLTLAENTDYTLTWDNNVNVGSEAKVTVTAVENGNYADSTYGTFTILPKALTAAGMSVSDIEDVVYNGVSQTPKPVVKDGEKELLEGTDYTLKYSENTTDVGTVTVTVTGAGNYAVEGVTVTKTYDITAKGITAADGVTVTVPDGVVYDGAAHAQNPKSVVDEKVPQDRQTLKEGSDYTLSWSGEKDGDKVTAAGTVTITVSGIGNYTDKNSTAKYAIRPQNIEEGEADWLSVAVDDPIAETVYDSQAHQWEPQLTYTKAGEKDTAMVEGTDYTVEYTRDDGMAVTDARFFKDVGTITVTIKGINNFTGTVVKSYKITPKPVTIKAAGAKLFGAVDPKFAVGATAEDAAVHDADNWLMVTFDGIVPGEEKLFDGKDGDDVLTVKTAQRDPGDDMEQPGKYAIDVTVDDTKATNYKVTVDENVGAFTISDKAAFTVTLGDTEKADDIDTHTLGQVKYDIVANQGQKLIPNLQSYINVSLLVDVTGVAGNYVTPDAPDALTKNVPESIAQDVRTDAQAGTAASADADKTGTFTIPAIAYSAQHEGTSPLTWHSGLPAGTKLTVKIVSSKEGASTIATVISPEIVTVVAKAADMSSEYAAGAGKNAFLDGDPSANGRVVLDAGGTVTIKPADGKEYIGADDWITLTVGGKTYHYSVFSYSELLGGAAPAADGTLVLNLNMLKALAGVSGEEGGWFGANPTGKLTVSAVVFDGVNHTVGTTTLDVAFDTGAVDSSQTVENRITAETLKLAISDSVNAAPNVAAAGQFGGASITEDIAAVGGASGTLTWNNVTKWMQTPETLAHSGNTITITYLDCVGNQVNHTLTVVRSAAVTSNTLYVQPMKNDTVPGKSLTFYGETNAWEQGILTIGGTSFPVEPIAGGDSYDNSTKRWQVVVNLGDINFPVGEPTTVSMAYEDLNGGEATIRITYKDQAQTPILSSEPIVGSQALWGYVESGATVSVSVYHTDGTVTQIPQDNIAVDQFGYFYVRLSSPLEEGEQIVVSTSDFCDNQKSFTVSVQKELKADATAEVLGANIIGELMGTTNIQHRFATPIDLGALDQAENKTMTLPILAYKSIEIGKVTFSLKTPGKMNVSYNIKSTNSIPVGGAARMKTFDYKPTIDELVGGELSTVVKDLKTAPAGNIPAIDVSAYQAEDGTYGGIIWLQFEFDVDMTEDNFVSRGGRDARFYRWLTESLQTEGVLGAVYQETSAYEDNVGYYNQYQRFENISKMS